MQHKPIPSRFVITKLGGLGSPSRFAINRCRWNPPHPETLVSEYAGSVPDGPNDGGKVIHLIEDPWRPHRHIAYRDRGITIAANIWGKNTNNPNFWQRIVTDVTSLENFSSNYPNGSSFCPLGSNSIHMSALVASPSRKDFFGWIASEATQQGNRIYFVYTPDNFATFFVKYVGLFIVRGRTSFVISSHNGNLWLAGTEKVWHSPDWGQTWSQTSITFNPISYGGGSIHMPASTRNGTSNFSDEGLQVFLDFGIYRSGWGGISNPINLPDLPLSPPYNRPGARALSRLKSFAKNGKYVSALVSNGEQGDDSGGDSPFLLISSDGGQTFTAKPSHRLPLNEGTDMGGIIDSAINPDFILAYGRHDESYSEDFADIPQSTLIYTLDRGNTWYSLIKSPLIYGPNDLKDYPYDVVSSHSTIYANDVPDQSFNDGPADCPICYAGVPKGDYPIELRHGEKYEEATDLVVNSPGGELTFARTFRQNKIWHKSFQLFGMGWTHNHHMRLRQYTYHDPTPEEQQQGQITQRMIVVQLPGGGEAYFKEDSIDHYIGFDGVDSKITLENGQYVLTASDKSVYRFGPTSGLHPGAPLLSKTWPNGEVWTYTYRNTFPLGELDQVTDGYGRKLVFQYHPSTHAHAGKLYRVGDHTFNGSDPVGRYVEFTYQFNKLERNGQILSDTKSLLKKVRDVRGNTWTYDYYGQQAGETVAERLNFLVKVTSPSVDVTGANNLQPIVVKNLTYNTSAQDFAQLNNGGMEDDWGIPPLGGWQGLNGLSTTRSTTHDPTAGGSYSRRLATNLANQGIESSFAFDMKAGRTYHITARVLPVQGSLQMMVTPPSVLDLANGISERYTDKLSVTLNAVTGPNDWLTMETVFTPSRTTMGHRLRFVTKDAAPSHEFYIDNVSIRESIVDSIQQVRGNSLITTDYTFHNPDNTTVETTAGLPTTHVFTNGVLGGTSNAAGNYVAQHINKQYRADRITDARENDTLMEWSSDGKQLLKVTDAKEQTTQFNYNTSGTLNYSIDTMGRKTQYLYNDANQPRLPTEIKVFEPNDTTLFRWQKFTYDAKGRTTKEQTIDPNNPTTPTTQQEATWEYNTSGNGNGLLYRVIRKDLITPANNQSTTYDYDSAGRVIKTIQNTVFGNCTKTFTLYDDAGNVIASVCNYEPGGADPQNLTQVMALFNEAMPDKNKITLHDYDQVGRRIKTTTNAGASYKQESLTVYDALGRVVRTITNYVSNTSILDPYVADRNLFLHGAASDKNLVTDTAYNAAGQVRKQTDVMGNVTLYGYDAAGRVVKVVKNASQPGYNNDYGVNGHPDLDGYPAGNAPDQDIIALSEYDQAGNLVKSSEVLKVDSNGDPVSENVTLYAYDELNRPIMVIRNASKPNYFTGQFYDPELKNYITRLTQGTPTYVPSADKDLIENIAYDAMGNAVSRKGSVDVQGSGNTTEFKYIETLSVYDNRGRAVRSIQNYKPQGTTNPKDWIWNGTQWKVSSAVGAAAVSHSAYQDENIITDTAYDDQNRVMYTLDTLGRRTWTAYDGLGRVVKTIVNAVGTATDGGVNDPRSASYVRSADSDKDRITTTAYDENGQVKYTQDTLGRRTWYAYDTLGRQIKTIVNAVGTAEDYGANDPRSISYVPSTDADKDIITRTSYGTQDRVEFTYDAMNYPTKYLYDDLGRTIKTITNYVDGNFSTDYPDQDVTQSTLHEMSPHRTTVTDARGTSTRHTYDKLGRPAKVTVAVGVVGQEITTYTCYDKLGRVLRVIQNYRPQQNDPSPDARDATTGAWLFNPATHGVNNDENLITEYVLDNLGRVTATKNPKGITSSAIAYMQDGQPLTVRDALLGTTRFVYDGIRRRRLVVLNYQTASGDPANWVWTTNAGGRWESGFGGSISFGSLTNPDQNIIAQGNFDRAGRLLSVRDPGGKLVEYTYDLLDRRTNLKADNKNWQTVFTNMANGTLRTVLTDPKSVATTRDTDKAGRLVSLQFGAETPRVTPEVTFDYNKLGSMLAMYEWTGGATPIRSTVRQFDALQRVKQIDFSEGGASPRTVQYGYDAGGLRTKLTLPGNLSILYGYDERGLMKTLKDWDLQVTSLAYDQAGRLKTVQRPGYVFSVYDYDVLGQLTGLSHSRQPPVGAASILATYNYTMDDLGNRVDVLESMKRTGGTSLARNYHHTYDALSRLTQTVQRSGSVPGSGTIQTQFDYRYDVSGNRKQKINTISGASTTTDYLYGPNNRLDTVGIVDQEYDNNGNLLTGNQAWDRMNRLLSANGHSYTYDGMGQRITKNDGTKTTNYLLDLQSALSQVLETIDAATTRYVHGPGVLHGSASGQQSVSRYALQDGLGSVRSVVSTTGVVQEARDYSPYGEILATEGTNTFLFGYTGEPADDNGLLHLRARYYNPGLGVFPNLDPLEGDMSNPLSLNRYAYVLGNPINLVDPAGLCAWWGDYQEIKKLVPLMYEIAGKWNRIYQPPNTLKNIFKQGLWCGLPEVIKKVFDTGFSDTAFVALMASHIHQEGRLRGGKGRGIIDFLGDQSFILLDRDASLGIANIRPYSTAKEIFEGKIPVPSYVEGALPDGTGGYYIPLQIGNRLDRVRRIRELLLITYATGDISQPRKFDFYSKPEVSLELLGANINRGIIRVKALGENPTIFNLGTWFSRGIQSPRSFAGASKELIEEASDHGNNLIPHMIDLVTEKCDIGLKWSSYPKGEFTFFSEFERRFIRRSNQIEVDQWLKTDKA